MTIQKEKAAKARLRRPFTREWLTTRPDLEIETMASLASQRLARPPKLTPEQKLLMERFVAELERRRGPAKTVTLAA